jgi:glycosyltransferase involved in cell wall biosynthesis
MTRLMIYAQVPPPVHGQSVMVGHLIDGLRAANQIDLESNPNGNPAATIAYCHVNPRISEDLGDIGRWRPRKLFLVFYFIFTAIRMRFRHGLDTFYFVPAPPKRGALYRDWCVLLFCRPFFRRLVLHWHCIGQPEFMLKKLSAPERFLAGWLYGGASLSIVLSNYSREEASYFKSVRTEVVPNGIPDPCPQFDTQVWPERQARAKAMEGACTANAPEGSSVYYQVLFIAGRMTQKGLFDSMAAVKEANKLLAGKNLPLRVRLTVAGSFDDDAERGRFETMAKEINSTQLPGKHDPLAIYIGWASEEKKKLLFRAADCLIFPTFYPAESFGLVLTEAMAHGCAIITTRWQAVPEVLPAAYENIVEPHDIAAMAKALLRCASAPADRSLRDYFLARFTRDRFAQQMITVLSELSYNDSPKAS